MATIKFKRGLEANRLSQTPLESELIYITDTNKVYIGDGSTTGGTPLNDSSSEIIAKLLTVDGIGSGLDGDLLDAIPGTALLRNDQDGSVTGEVELNDSILASINTTPNANSVVDVFLYDTTKDSDGGQWRNRCSHLSWYNEPLNTATRGATKEFPAIALIVAESTKLTIYDATDSNTPMWMVFDSGVGNHFDPVTINSITVVNGLIVMGYPLSGISRINLLTDVTTRLTTTEFDIKTLPISQRNSLSNVDIETSTSDYLVDFHVNDVAITVLDSAPIDTETGLPIPTIAVATDGGVSVIHNDGTVTSTTSTDSGVFKVEFKDNKLLAICQGLNGTLYTELENLYHESSSANLNSIDNWNNYLRGADSTPSLQLGAEALLIEPKTKTLGSNLGLMSLNIPTLLNTGYPSLTDGMVNYIAKDYQSGWMQDDIKGAFLANSKTADRSINNNPLVETGSVTENPVATGSELMTYSGFSDVNYLSQPYNSDLDFGTGDFYIMGWMKFSDVSTIQTVLEFYDTSLSVSRKNIEIRDSGQIRFIDNGNVDSSYVATVDTWVFVVGTRHNGEQSLFINGDFDNSGDFVGSNGAGGDVLHIGRRITPGVPAFSASLALWRIGAGAPSANQIKEIYESEKHLFKENTACTLSSTTDSAVNALAYDEDTKLLYVAGTDNLDIFDGLVRTNSEVGAYTSLSAVDGMVIKGN